MIEIPYWALFSCTHLLAAAFGIVAVATVAAYLNGKKEKEDATDVFPQNGGRR